jgi:nitrogen fixation NifU-like protein
MDVEFKRSIILDNYQGARNRGIPDSDGYIKINSNSESCIDNIDIYVKVNNNIIEDVKYEGEACVIAISSTSILSSMIIGKSINEVENILKNYYAMIEEQKFDRELLGEACVYDDIYKQPARKTCVTLFARGIEKVLNSEKDNM